MGESGSRESCQDHGTDGGGINSCGSHSSAGGLENGNWHGGAFWDCVNTDLRGRHSRGNRTGGINHGKQKNQSEWIKSYYAV